MHGSRWYHGVACAEGETSSQMSEKSKVMKRTGENGAVSTWVGSPRWAVAWGLSQLLEETCRFSPNTSGGIFRGPDWLVFFSSFRALVFLLVYHDLLHFCRYVGGFVSYLDFLGFTSQINPQHSSPCIGVSAFGGTQAGHVVLYSPSIEKCSCKHGIPVDVLTLKNIKTHWFR